MITRVLYFPPPGKTEQLKSDGYIEGCLSQNKPTSCISVRVDYKTILNILSMKISFFPPSLHNDFLLLSPFTLSYL